MDELADARYISLTTYKRDGQPVATPVWIAGTGKPYVFTTGDKAWKTRRLRRDPRVQVQISDMRGRPKPGAATYTGTGAVKDDPDSVAAAERAIGAKYGWQYGATKVVDRLHRILHLGEPQAVVAIELTLDPGASAPQ
jgi:PPOX class probable F420-dependent enzyme